MNTEDLIASLASDLRPASRKLARGHFAVAIGAGGFAALILMLLALGLRPDIARAMAGMMFWMKIAYTASIAALALAAAFVLTRPEAPVPRGLWFALAPIAVFAALSARELADAPAADRLDIWMGQTWAVCPAIVLSLSLPIMAALMVAARGLAPTQLRLSGAVIGLAAGGAAAAIYSLHCPEATATFVFSWYTLGIMLAAAVGGLLGPRLLRW
jgi:hypothetical protein